MDRRIEFIRAVTRALGASSLYRFVYGFDDDLLERTEPVVAGVFVAEGFLDARGDRLSVGGGLGVVPVVLNKWNEK